MRAACVTCNLPDLAAGATVDFDLVVTVAGSASGTITLGNYSIAGTGYPALLGPARSTVVNSPVAAPDSYTTNRNTALVVAAPGVLANDTDPNGDALTAVLVDRPGARHADAERERELHLHPCRRLHRSGQLHLPRP